MIERDKVTRRVHVTAGYLVQRLHEYPDLADALSPPMSAERAIEELSKLPTGSLIGCGSESCAVPGCPDNAEAKS
jgi:hypothetical protein